MTSPSSGFFVDGALARRIEITDAWVGLESARIHAQLYPASGATSLPVPGGYALFLGIGSPLTQTLGLGMSGEVASEHVAAVEDFFRSRGADVLIELCPLAHRSVVAVLADRGYGVAGFSNMLVRRLGNPVSPASIADLTVKFCEPSEAFVWAQTILEGFVGALPASDENIAVLTSLFYQPEAVCLLARVNGVPAGGGALSVHEGVAALYGASTIPAFRRRGIQGAIIQSLVAQAIERGCDLAYTLTEPGSVSQRNLERQQFRVGYTRVTLIRRLTSP